MKYIKINVLQRLMLAGLMMMGAQVFAADKPNVIILLADNLGYGDLGSYGGGVTRGAPTPNLDALAAEGTRFTNFNVESECTPSRSALMTGRMPIRSGTTRAVPIPGLPVGLAPYEYTIAEMASDQGYDTAIFGKWHLGYVEERLPTNHGFDEWWGFPFSTDVAQFPSSLGFEPSLFKTNTFFEGTKGGEIKALDEYNLESRPYVDERITQKSVDYINKHAKSDKPFFLYVPFSLVHHPSIAHPDFQGKSGAGRYGDAMMEHDYRVKQILDAVKESGIEDNTIIVYASDNGPDRSEYPYIGHSGAYRGYLGTVHEGSIRTPMIMRWPGNIPAGRVTNEIVSINDIFPTIASIIGGEMPTDRAIDGIDQKDFILGKQEKSNRESVVFFAGDQLMAVKWRQFKIYVHDETADVRNNAHTYGKLWAPRAYNLEQDPSESNDLGMHNLWLLAAALPSMLELVYSVEKHGLILSGGHEPEVFEIEVPFFTPENLKLTMNAIKKDSIKNMVQKKIDQLMGNEEGE